MSIYLIESSQVDEIFPGLKDTHNHYPESERIATPTYRVGDPVADDMFDMPLRDARGVWEREYFQHQLDRFHGNVTRVAVFTGMDRSACHRKLSLLEINFENPLESMT